MLSETEFLTVLQSLKGVRISVDTLIEKTQAESYTDAAQMIRAIEEKGMIQRIESSGSNGRFPMLYQRYRLLTKPASSSPAKDEVQRELLGLHPKIKTEHYAKYRQVYTRHRSVILKISEFLKRCDREDVPYVAINERSFEWFKDEKYLHSVIHSKEADSSTPHRTSSFLSRLGLTLDDLRVYESNESFFYYYTPFTSCPAQFLIIENKDTYVTLQKLLIEQQTLAFKGLDIPITGVIYGEGFKIVDSLRTSFQHPDPVFTLPTTHYWYIGDLDYAGLSIYLKLKETYHDRLTLNYFPHYFDYLIESFELKFPGEAWPLVTNKDKTHQPLPFHTYEFLLPSPLATTIQSELEAGGYLPQEVMSRVDWQRLINRGE